jgi:polyhydroxybutyrate depolymerase
MKTILLGMFVSGLAVVLSSCGGNSAPSASSGGAGGGMGGSPSTGGASGSGGKSGAGGSSATGGSIATGGMPASGGRSGTGGGSAVGGAPGTGGLPGSGGSSAGGSGGSRDAGAQDASMQDTGTQDAGSMGGRGGSTAAGGSAGGGTGTGGIPSVDGGVGSPGCGKAIARPDPKTQQTMDIQGTTRYYLLDVPSSADSKTPLMLIFALHGHNMNNLSVVSMYNFTSRSGGKAITVYPQGDGDAPGTTSKWGSGITSNWTSNDANYAFIQTLKADLENRFCIDTSREFFTGFSMGGMFTNAIACAHSSWFRGYAPVEGMGPGSCADKSAMPAIMIHQGTADTTVTPTAGGEPTRDFWIKQNGCNQTTTSAFTGCQSYGACAEPVVYCVGNWTHTVDAIATANIWSFFSGLQ